MNMYFKKRLRALAESTLDFYFQEALRMRHDDDVMAIASLQIALTQATCTGEVLDVLNQLDKLVTTSPTTEGD